MEKTKKILTISTIVATCLTSLLLILALFKVNVLGEKNWSMIITLACLTVGGFFVINSLNMVDRNAMLGWVSLGMIAVSVFLIILSTWVSIQGNLFIRITSSLGLLSVLFNIIVSAGLDLGRSNLVIQIIVFLIVGVTDIIATLGIFGAINLAKIILVFITLIILSIVGVIVLKVLAKKRMGDLLKQEKDMVKISKQEYEVLIDKAKKYDEMISKIQASKSE